MDKVIIDGIDISGCPFYQYQTKEDYEMRYPESGDCEIGLAGYLFDYSRITEELEKACIDNPNCYYKQLKRLQAENEELKKTVLQKCPNCNEEYLSPIGAKLYEENAELKEQLNKKDDLINDITNGGIQLQKECEELNKDLDYYEENANKYFIKYERCKQALQDIRELIKKLDLSLGCAYGDYDCDNCSDINEETVCKIKLQNIIIAKINEVIGVE